MPNKRQKVLLTLDEINMLIDWWNGNMGGGAKLYAKLLRIKNKVRK